MKYLNTYNESIKDFLKPKSHEDILKDLNKLSDKEKFEKSCEYGITSVVKDLVDNGFDPSWSRNIGIRISSENGYLDIVKLLLKDRRVDPSDDNNVAIRHSSFKGQLKIVKELLKDKRVDPSDYNNDAIFWSSQCNHLDVVKELLKDERVRNTLSKEDLKKYEKQIKK